MTNTNFVEGYDLYVQSLTEVYELMKFAKLLYIKLEEQFKIKIKVNYFFKNVLVHNIENSSNKFI